jgi:CRISPR-associated protein Csb2
MPTRDGRSETKTLIFDAFARVDPDDPLLAIWPDIELDEAERRLLDVLLTRMGYLGRAESWVEASLDDAWDGSFDSAPVTDGEVRPAGVDKLNLATPMAPDAYRDWRDRQVDERELTGRRLNKGEQRLLATLPPRLIDALRLDTGPVQKEGWSQHPGLWEQLYTRPEGALRPRVRKTSISQDPRKTVTTATFVLYRKPKPSIPLPRIVDAVKIGEALRASVMSHADRQSAEEGTIPPELSGHDMPEDNRHDHAFYLPHDADGDGRIDRIVVHADAGLGERAMKALCAVRRLWIDGGSEWRILLEDFGHRSEFSAHPYLRRSRVWQSFTPYLHPWYRKKGFMHLEQIRRECRERGLPEPDGERLEGIEVTGRELRAVHFHRFRGRKGLRQPDTRGSLWRLVFPEPVPGPIALGFGCHLGLGIFAALED